MSGAISSLPHATLWFTFTDKRQKDTELRNAKAVPRTVVREPGLLSDPRREERERRQNAIIVITNNNVYTHTTAVCRLHNVVCRSTG